MDKSIYLAYMYSFYIVFENSIKYKLVEQLLSPSLWKGFSFEQELYLEVEGKIKMKFFWWSLYKIFLVLFNLIKTHKISNSVG